MSVSTPSMFWMWVRSIMSDVGLHKRPIAHDIRHDSGYRDTFYSLETSLFYVFVVVLLLLFVKRIGGSRKEARDDRYKDEARLAVKARLCNLTDTIAQLTQESRDNQAHIEALQRINGELSDTLALGNQYRQLLREEKLLLQKKDIIQPPTPPDDVYVFANSHTMATYCERAASDDTSPNARTVSAQNLQPAPAATSPNAPDKSAFYERVLPVPTLPHNADPEHASPADTSPNEPPMQSNHERTSPVATSSVNRDNYIPERDAPTQDAPELDAPVQEAPVPHTPEDVAPAHDAPAHDAPAHAEPSHHAPEHVTPEHVTSEHDAPERDAAERNAPEHDEPTRDEPKRNVPPQDENLKPNEDSLVTVAEKSSRYKKKRPSADKMGHQMELHKVQVRRDIHVGDSCTELVSRRASRKVSRSMSRTADKRVA